MACKDGCNCMKEKLATIAAKQYSKADAAIDILKQDLYLCRSYRAVGKDNMEWPHALLSAAPELILYLEKLVRMAQ